MPMMYKQDAAKNPDFIEQKRPTGENNLAWVQRALDNLGEDNPAESAYILLLGANDTLAWRLRLAQSHLRFDMLPSYWSTAVLLIRHKSDPDKHTILHVPLLQPADASFAAERNGVMESPLSDIDDAHKWKNIALIAFPVAQQQVLDQRAGFERGRSYLDALEHILRWLAFAWGVARTPNPIFDGTGMPSACMLESLFASAGLDITPNLESRASSPEAIWATAHHWGDYYTQNNQSGPKGRYFTPHRYDIKNS